MKISITKNDLSIVFPQANDIYKVIKFVDQNTYNSLSNWLKYSSLDFVTRQKHYYKNAAIYLGLFNKNKPSNLALSLFKLSKNELFISMVGLILEHEVFYLYFINRNKKDVESFLISNYKMNEVTAKRRCSTVVNWIKWCDAIIKENDIVVEVVKNEHY